MVENNNITIEEIKNNFYTIFRRKPFCLEDAQKDINIINLEEFVKNYNSLREICSPDETKEIIEKIRDDVKKEKNKIEENISRIINEENEKKASRYQSYP